jgi:hypothetical protein
MDTSLDADAVHDRTPDARKIDIRLALLCGLISTVAVLLVNPRAEVGLFDDWAYTLTARELAQDGVLRFHGWETALAFIQSGWAALWVRAFGFSYTLVRLTNLPFVFACGGLLYLLCRMADLSPRAALFGTLVLTLSPVYLPLTASFMTDVPGLFFLLAVIYCFSRAMPSQHGNGRHSGVWLASATVLAVLGGTNRQTIWLAPLVCLPYAATAWRAERAKRRLALCLWVVSVAAVGGLYRWQAAQPFNIQDATGEQLIQALRQPAFATGQAVQHLGKFILLLVPALFGTPFLWAALRRLPRGFVVLAVVLSMGACVIAVLPPRFLPAMMGSGDPRNPYLAPWDHDGNLVTSKGVLNAHLTTLGDRPDVLPRAVWVSLTGLVAFVFLILVGEFIRLVGSRFALPKRIPPAESPVPGWPPVLRLLGLYGAVYLPTLQPRLLSGNAFDRYHLPLLLLCVLGLLWHGRHTTHPRVLTDRWCRFGWGLLAAFALFALTTTHDYLAMMRAIATASRHLEASGVRRSDLSAAFEYDCWTEAESNGYVNDSRIRRPPNAYRAARRRRPVPLDGAAPFWWGLTPSVQPRWLVVNSVQRGLLWPSMSVEYHRWLPLGRGHVYAQRLPPVTPAKAPEGMRSSGVLTRSSVARSVGE